MNFLQKVTVGVWEQSKVLFPSVQLAELLFISTVFLIVSLINDVGAACQHGQISPDPNNCANYLQCNHDQEMSRPCPSGLLFNPTSLTCDWPDNVQCGSTGDNNSVTTTTTVATQTTSSPTTSAAFTTSGSMPTSTAGAFPSPPIPIGDGQEPRFAPYFDVNLLGVTLPQVYSKTGQKDFTLAFALGSSEGCKPKWGGVTEIDDQSVIKPIRELQALGGQFIVATGGAMGPYFEQLCTNVDDLAGAYKKVLDTVGTTHIDVDIESTVDADRMNKALAKVQNERPNTTVSYTLMVQAEDYGLTPALGVDILKNAKANGVRVTIVNPMTMEFGGPSADFGDSVIGAAASTLQQMKLIWPEKTPEELRKMLGVTPMIGRNFNGKIFTQDHAKKLVNWANTNKIGFLGFWSVGRDNGNCAGGSISPSCSSIAQNEYEFTKLFQEFKV